MTRVIVSRQADADVDDMLERLYERAGIAVVERYTGDLQAIDDRLEMYPDSGSPRPTLCPNMRIAILSPYLIIYDHAPNDETVTIVRVLDGRRNITRQLVRP
jgi:toxin ParE1/3/4